jgi:hypothetical protein
MGDNRKDLRFSQEASELSKIYPIVKRLHISLAIHTCKP